MLGLCRDIRAASIDPDIRVSMPWGKKEANSRRWSQMGDYRRLVLALSP